MYGLGFKVLGLASRPVQKHITALPRRQQRILGVCFQPRAIVVPRTHTAATTQPPPIPTPLREEPSCCRAAAPHPPGAPPHRSPPGRCTAPMCVGLAPRISSPFSLCAMLQPHLRLTAPYFSSPLSTRSMPLSSVCSVHLPLFYPVYV